ncbi:MAG: hypothetical protein DWP92_05530 [Armatimonadetes bacterium]|nr:MAG: hypothetical protein DWP92_05530 [Armatimonadota bacterium]
MAEYLDENLAFAGVDPWLGGADAIRRTWDRIGDGVTSTTPQRAIEEVIAESTTGDTLGTVLEGFGIANYLMDEPVHDAYGYTDPDAGGWRANERLIGARPTSAAAALTTGVMEAGSIVLHRGGSHYVEFKPSDTGAGGSIQLTPTPVNGVAYTALRVTTDSVIGATLCDDGFDSVVALTPGVATEIPLDGGCETVTLVATSTDLDSDTRTAAWEALFVGDNNLLANPGFESGGIGPGWGIFKGDGFPGDTVFGVGGSPVRTGSFAALLTSGEGSSRTVPAGYDQVVQVTPGQSYSGFVWFARSSGAYPDVILEITESDGTVVASKARTVFAGGWQLLDVSFTAPSDSVVFRAGLDGPYGESRGTAIDDAVLVEGDIGTLDNRSFDNGLDAWSIVGGTDGTVTAVGGGGITAAELVSQTGQPVGVEQWFNGSGFNAANATVTVDSLSDTQVTLDILRLDGTVVTTWSETLNSTDGWVTIGDVGWGYQDEDALVYRITTQGPGAVRVDATFVSLAL